MTPAAGATAAVAGFAVEARYEKLPEEVRNISRLLLLDSVGCALAAVTVEKGRFAIEVARQFGVSDEASIIGGPAASAVAAAFANGELVNGLDMDAILLPGHITPYVVPPVLALAEARGRDGRDLIAANAVAHEVGARVAGSYAPLRTLEASERGVEYSLSPATGYGSCIVGAAAGAARLLDFDETRCASCLGVAGYMAPVPGLGKYLRGQFSPHVKYTSAGWVAAGAVTAARLVERGYDGDPVVLDGEFGLWRMFASPACDWETMLGGLGERWRILESEIKPYPSFRMGHPGIEAFADLLEAENLSLEEIDLVTLTVDPISMSQLYLNTEMRNHTDAQLSWAHVLGAVALYPPGVDWQSDDALSDPQIKALAPKIVLKPQEQWASQLERDVEIDPGVVATPFSIPIDVVVTARGSEFRAVPLRYPAGHPERPMSDDEVSRKFVHNATQTLGAEAAADALERLLDLDNCADVSHVLRGWRRP